MSLHRLLCAATVAALVMPCVARSETCQNSNQVVETIPALDLLETVEGQGVDCEINVFGLGWSGSGLRDAVPSPKYSEAYVQHTPVELGLTEMSRELALLGSSGLQRLTAYRLWFTGAADKYAASAEIVLERLPNDERRLQLWWSKAGPLGRSSRPVKLIDLPYRPGVSFCAKGPATGCVRSRWVHGNGGASVSIELSSGGVMQKVEMPLADNKPLPPSLELGYVHAVQGTDLQGSVGLRHRLCQYRNASGAGGDSTYCTPHLAWELHTADPVAPANTIVSVRVDLRNQMPYALRHGLYVITDDPGDSYVGAAGNGWNCDSVIVPGDEERTELQCVHSGAAEGAVPQLLLQFRAPPSGGYSRNFQLRYGAQNFIGEKGVAVPAPGAH